MQHKIPAKLARQYIFGAYAAGLLAAGPARAGALHEDGKAGIRFRIPFAQYEEKSGAQVTALVLADPRVKIPTGIEITSGVYDATGEPFLVVWTKTEGVPPTQKQLLDLAGASPFLRRLMPWTRGLPEDLHFDAEALRGSGTLKPSGGLKGRALLQVTREGSVFVGLFYRGAGDAELLDQVGEGLAVLPGRGVRFAELAPGGLTLRALIAVAAAVLIFGLGLGALTWRRPRIVPPAT